MPDSELTTARAGFGAVSTLAATAFMDCTAWSIAPMASSPRLGRDVGENQQPKADY